MFFSRVRQRLELRPSTDIAGAIARITGGATLTPENLWLLACSAVLASIGLDVSSAAVVIGAMLISPLIGPILGLGLGMGVTDRPLLQRALQELALATGISLAVSAAYFLISPLATPTAELIARTRPTLLDVGVAFFGGVAGIVASSRKQHSLALPGAAIATALMPPLCTAGFGLATANWSFFLGAMYLFSLNAIFIALSAFIVVRVLHFPHHTEVTPEERRRERHLVAVVATVAILPSIYFLYDTARAVREGQRIRTFVENEIDAPGRAAQQWERTRDNGFTGIKVYVAGHPIDAVTADSLRALLPHYGLADMNLEFVQSDISAQDFETFQGDVQRDVLRAVAVANAARDSAAQVRERQDTLRLTSVAREAARIFPEIEAITYVPRADLLAPDSQPSPPAFLLRFARRTSQAERSSISARVLALLKGRLNSSDLIVLER